MKIPLPTHTRYLVDDTLDLRKNAVLEAVLRDGGEFCGRQVPCPVPEGGREGEDGEGRRGDGVKVNGDREREG